MQKQEDFQNRALAQLSGEVLLPFPLVHEDATRQQIDDAVSETLGVDTEWVAAVRRELAREPSVTNAQRV